MNKRIICFFTITILLFSVIINNFNVNASVIVPSDDSTHYYIYNHIDFTDWLATDILTINNYNNLYDSLTGNDKEQITNQFISNYNNIDVKLSNSLINPNYEVDTNNINASGLFFTPIIYNGVTIDFDLCNKFIGWNTSANQFFTVLFYSPSGDQIVNSSYYTLSDNLFILSYTYYGVTEKVIDNDTYLQFHYNGTLQQNAVLNSQQNIYYKEFGSDYHYFYYDDVCLFTSSYFTQINDPYKAYNLYKQGDSLSIDRRTSNFLDKLNGDNSDNNDIIQDGFDPKLFNGELGFNSFNASASLNYNSTTDLYEPFFDIKYQPNNYTEINIEDITLYYQAEVFLKLTLSKNMTNFYYTSTRYKTSGQGSLDRSGTSTNANRYEFILYAMSNPPLGNASWNNTSTRSSAGINTQFGVSTFSGSNIDYDISSGISAYKHNNYVVVPSESEALEMINDYLNGKNGNIENKSYGYYKIQLYIKNNVTGDISTTYSSIFDLFGNKISDNSSSMINNDDQAYNDFVNDFYYLDKDGDLTPVDYADRINSYGGNSSIGDITIYQNPYPYVLVDIPENEWLSYTPNLRTLLTEFKTMLAEVHDESVLKMLPETYNYLPAPFMNYMLYGVGLIVMIGIWRAITRR